MTKTSFCTTVSCSDIVDGKKNCAFFVYYQLIKRIFVKHYQAINNLAFLTLEKIEEADCPSDNKNVFEGALPLLMRYWTIIRDRNSSSDTEIMTGEVKNCERVLLAFFHCKQTAYFWFCGISRTRSFRRLWLRCNSLEQSFLCIAFIESAWSRFKVFVFVYSIGYRWLFYLWRVDITNDDSD